MGLGGVVGKSNQPILTSASGVWSLREQQLARKANLWPPLGGDPVEYKSITQGSGSGTMALPTRAVGDILIAGVQTASGSSTGRQPTNTGSLQWTVIQTVLEPSRVWGTWAWATVTDANGGDSAWSGAAGSLNRHTIMCFSGQSQNPIGATQFSTGNTWPETNLQNTSGSSAIIHMLASSSLTPVISDVPWEYVVRGNNSVLLAVTKESSRGSAPDLPPIYSSTPSPNSIVATIEILAV